MSVSAGAGASASASAAHDLCIWLLVSFVYITAVIAIVIVIIIVRYALHDWDHTVIDPKDGSLTLLIGDTQPPLMGDGDGSDGSSDNGASGGNISSSSSSSSSGGGTSATNPNWLPAPKGQQFSLTVRLYWPLAAALNRSWTLPPLRAAYAYA